MSKFDRADPGTDPDYCNALSDEPDPIESDLQDLHSTVASLMVQSLDLHDFEALMRLRANLEPIETAIWRLRIRLIDRAEALTKEPDQQLWGV
jgi:hypothetical protein